MTSSQHPNFYNAMMTGLFAGIIDTLICLTYNIGYRSITGYSPSAIINVSSLIFAINLILLLVGMVYYIFLRVSGKGTGVYLVVILLLTAFLTWKSVGLIRFNDPRLDNEFRGLLTGIILILGVSAACLPFLYRSKKFMENVI